jgi:hypothetical protein
MSIFKKKSQAFFQEEPVEVRFNILADFVKELDSKADYNKAIGAMESIFNAYQKLRGIKTDDDVLDSTQYILNDKEVK